MKLGFVGTGAITEAIVTGVLRSSLVVTGIVISPRNREVAARLAAASPLVHVAADNQGVVDQAEIVFLAIRPQVAREVIAPLSFRAGQEVVSLIAAVQISALADWIGEAVPITRAIPPPFVANLNGVTASHPPNPRVAAIFDALGEAVQAPTLKAYDLLGVGSALMGSYFGILDIAARWLEERGMPAEQARTYLASLFASLSEVAASSKSSFEELRLEYSTKGGVNEQVFNDFVQGGGALALTRALSSVLERYEKR